MERDFNQDSYREPPASRRREVQVRSFFEKGLLIDRLAMKYQVDIPGVYRLTAREYGSKGVRKERLGMLIKHLAARYRTEKGEVFQRPEITLEYWGDCDDQAIAVCAWCRWHSVPYNTVFMGQGRVTHVTVRVFLEDFGRSVEPFSVGGRDKGVIADALPYKIPDDCKIYCENK